MINTILRDISASLWAKPATLRELNNRDFCKNYSEYGLYNLLCLAKHRGWIYEKQDKYYCYKKTIIDVLNPNEYEINL
jgi:hypothetical protein